MIQNRCTTACSYFKIILCYKSGLGEHIFFAPNAINDALRPFKILISQLFDSVC
ncbi:MAG: hypothetical protein RLZZ46_485 [Bacteroidota bacterium]